MSQHYWYLATPYKKYPTGKYDAYLEACKQTAFLLRSGYNIYSPIVHNYPLTLLKEMDNVAPNFWLEYYDIPMMNRAIGLIVCKLDSWKLSDGIKYEIDYFIHQNKPVIEMAPNVIPEFPVVFHNELTKEQFEYGVELAHGLGRSDILSIVQQELKPWQEHNFPGRPAWQPLVGMQEELGELSHAFLKKEQNIRLTEDHAANMKDAIADLLVYACDFSNALGIDLASELEKTWNEVKKRDWQKHRESHTNIDSNIPTGQELSK